MNESDFLRLIAQKRQNKISEITGLSTSQINRITAGTAGLTLPYLGSFLEALDLELIEHSNDQELVDCEELQALRALARRALERETA